MAFHFGISAGYSFQSNLDLPLRAELMLSSSNAGPPGGEGVEAVQVSRLDTDLAVLVGGGWTAVVKGLMSAGVEGLVGPRFRLIKVSTSVYDVSENHYASGLAAKGVAGLFMTFKALRLSMRTAICLPWDRTVELWVATGYTF